MRVDLLAKNDAKEQVFDRHDRKWILYGFLDEELEKKIENRKDIQNRKAY